MDKIQRHFKVKRGEREVVYPFTTFSCIFNSSLDNSIKDRLFKYLADIVTLDCPEPETRESVTSLSPLIIPTKQVKDSDLSLLTAKTNYNGNGRYQHDIVQAHFLENDAFTLATEVPVWDNDILGHIDIIRLFPDKIQVCDFKPKAHKETKAASQVHRYIDLLSRATRLPRSCFEGVYFDENFAYYLTTNEYGTRQTKSSQVTGK